MMDQALDMAKIAYEALDEKKRRGDQSNRYLTDICNC